MTLKSSFGGLYLKIFPKKAWITIFRQFEPAILSPRYQNLQILFIKKKGLEKMPQKVFLYLNIAGSYIAGSYIKNCLKVFQNLTAGSVKAAILFLDRSVWSTKLEGSVLPIGADRQPFCFWTDRYGLQSLQAQFTDR